MKTTPRELKVLAEVFVVFAFFTLAASPAQAFYVAIKGSVSASAIYPEPFDYEAFDTGQLQQLFVSHNATATVNSTYGSESVFFNATAQPGHLSAFASVDVIAWGGPTGLVEVRGGPEWSDTITITSAGTFNLTSALTSQVSGGPCNDLSGNGMDCSQTSATLYTSYIVTGQVPRNLTFRDQLDDGNQLQQTFSWTESYTLNAGDQIVVTQRLLIPLLGFSEDNVAVSASVDALNTGVFNMDPVTAGAAYVTGSGISYVSAIPIPPAFWLFGSALSFLAWARIGSISHLF